MKSELYQEMYKDYQKGLSLSEVATKYNITRQAVYTGFKRRNFKLRSKRQKEFVIYNNQKFTLRNNGYYGRTNGKREMLHRYKYEKEVGKIPNGWDIHHIDHNRLNNDIDNLVAMPKSIHAWLFSEGSNQFVKKTAGTEKLGVAEHYVNQFIANKYYM